MAQTRNSRYSYPRAQRRFQKGGFRTALKEIGARHPDKRLQLWFQDEARVGNKGRVCHRWWLKGQRPPEICDRRYQWSYIFTAVRPATGEDFTLVLPEVSTRAMRLFLDRFAEKLPEDAHPVVVLDGAGWHHVGTDDLPNTVSLVKLPPYRPELNPVERVWLHLPRALPQPARPRQHRGHRHRLLQRLVQADHRSRAPQIPLRLPLDHKGRLIDAAV